jgi:hypothetical protein
MKQLLFVVSLIFPIYAMDNQYSFSKNKKLYSIKYGKILVTIIQQNNLIKIVGSHKCLKKMGQSSNNKNITLAQEQFAREIAQACADARTECYLS